MQSKQKRIKLKIRIEFNEIEKRTSAGKKKSMKTKSWFLERIIKSPTRLF